GATVLHTPEELDAVALRLGIDPATAPATLDAARAALYAARQRRVPPHTDHKIVTAWNGLMISAFARASQVLAEPADARAAARAAGDVLDHMQVHGRLARSMLDGQPSGGAYLDDYAFFIGGLLDLYEATFDPRWLRAAIGFEQVVDQHFRDAEAGGYFLT